MVCTLKYYVDHFKESNLMYLLPKSIIVISFCDLRLAFSHSLRTDNSLIYEINSFLSIGMWHRDFLLILYSLIFEIANVDSLRYGNSQ